MLIVESDASNLGYGGILKQEYNNQVHIVRYHSGIWLGAQINYSTVKKEVLSIVLCVSKFQSDLINKKILLKIDCKAAKYILQKDVKNLVSKQIFARWQVLLSNFEIALTVAGGFSIESGDILNCSSILFIYDFPFVIVWIWFLFWLIPLILSLSNLIC